MVQGEWKRPPDPDELGSPSICRNAETLWLDDALGVRCSVHEGRSGLAARGDLEVRGSELIPHLKIEMWGTRRVVKFRVGEPGYLTGGVL